MRVKTNPGTYEERERELTAVLEQCSVSTWAGNTPDVLANRIAGLCTLLVEKKVLTLADLRDVFGAPHMEEVE